jgi:oxaloacetate decarboxylase (Na+ extruding) subunit alpha
MRAAGPVTTSYPFLSSPELEQIRRLMKVAQTPVVEIKYASMNLSLRRHSPDARLHERQCLD